jgi:hypothetical protein
VILNASPRSFAVNEVQIQFGLANQTFFNGRQVQRMDFLLEMSDLFFGPRNKAMVGIPQPGLRILIRWPGILVPTVHQVSCSVKAGL